MQSKPFARALAIAAMCSAAMSLAGSAQQMALSQIPAYKSRGKGKSRGGVGKSLPGAQMANIRAAKKARNVRKHRAANR